MRDVGIDRRITTNFTNFTKNNQLTTFELITIVSPLKIKEHKQMK